jgi:hypothetical protein
VVVTVRLNVLVPLRLPTVVPPPSAWLFTVKKLTVPSEPKIIAVPEGTTRSRLGTAPEPSPLFRAKQGEAPVQPTVVEVTQILVGLGSAQMGRLPTTLTRAWSVAVGEVARAQTRPELAI